MADERITQEAGAELHRGGVQASCSELKAIGPSPSRSSSSGPGVRKHDPRPSPSPSPSPDPSPDPSSDPSRISNQVLGPASRRAAGAEQEQLHNVSAHSLEPHDT